jgi:hypothetical protein
MCVIDETIAFMGGLDLCYGRWDTSQHVLIDEDHTDPDGPNGPVWRGKDYSNERVVEFSNLDKPFEDSIDRKKVPRMPWYVFFLLPHLLFSFAPLLPLVFICLIRTGRIELMIGTTLECRLSDNPLGTSVGTSSSDGISSSGPRYVISLFPVFRHGGNKKKY